MAKQFEYYRLVLIWLVISLLFWWFNLICCNSSNKDFGFLHRFELIYAYFSGIFTIYAFHWTLLKRANIKFKLPMIQIWFLLWGVARYISFVFPASNLYFIVNSIAPIFVLVLLLHIVFDEGAMRIKLILIPNVALILTNVIYSNGAIETSLRILIVLPTILIMFYGGRILDSEMHNSLNKMQNHFINRRLSSLLEVFLFLSLFFWILMIVQQYKSSFGLIYILLFITRILLWVLIINFKKPYNLLVIIPFLWIFFASLRVFFLAPLDVITVHILTLGVLMSMTFVFINRSMQRTCSNYLTETFFKKYVFTLLQLSLIFRMLADCFKSYSIIFYSVSICVLIFSIILQMRIITTNIKYWENSLHDSLK